MLLLLLLALSSAPALAGGVDEAFEDFQTDFEELVIEQERQLRRARQLSQEAEAVEQAGQAYRATELRRASADATRQAFAITLQLDGRLVALERVLAEEPEYLWVDLREKVARVRERVDETVAFGVEEVFFAELRAVTTLPPERMRGELDARGWRFVDEHADRIDPDRLYERVLNEGPTWFAEREAAARCAAVCEDEDLRVVSAERVARARLQDAELARRIASLHEELRRTRDGAELYRLTQTIEAAVAQRTEAEEALLRGHHTRYRVARTAAEAAREIGDVPARREYLTRAAATAPAPSARREVERELARLERWSLVTVSGLVASDGVGAVVDLGAWRGPHVRATVGPDRVLGGVALDLRRAEPWVARWLVPVGLEAGVRDGDALARATVGLSREWLLGHPGRKLRTGVTGALGYGGGLDGAVGLEVGLAVHPR